MEKAKIFIASSDKAYTLAQKLRDELTTDFSEATIWKDLKDEEPALTVSGMLDPDTIAMKTNKKFDFAVIILTRLLQEDQLSQEKLSQENCFYLAGLFTAALGRNRCFLLSSIKKQDLPDDLQDINCFKFDEPSNLEDEGDCADKIKLPASRIQTIIQGQGSRESQILLNTCSADIIFQKEKIKGEEKDTGDLSRIGSVVVSAVSPFEAENFEHAVRVRDNLDGGVKYIYFFQADINSAGKICQLLQNILLANLIPIQERKKTDFDTYIKEKKDAVLEGLWDVCFNYKLRIFFLQTEPSFEFCLHNADNSSLAKAYVKYKEDYILWDVPGKAHNIWRYLQKCCLPKQRHAIFLNTHCLHFITEPIKEQLDIICGASFSVIPQDVRAQLDTEFRTHFSGISREVMSLCYEGSILTFTDGKERGIFPGDQINGEKSKASGTVAWIKVTDGSYANGNASGKLILTDQTGIFEDEDLILNDRLIAKAKANP